MVASERLLSILRTETNRVDQIVREAPPGAPELPAIPLPPLTRPVEPVAAHMHDLAYGGSDSPFARQTQVLFENGGIIPAEAAAELEVPPMPIHPMVDVGEEGEIVSKPIILYFQEERQ